MATYQHAIDTFAAQAEEIALRLRVLQPRDPRTAPELSATINALYVLSTTLRALQTTVAGIRSTTVMNDLEDELGFLQPSLAWSLNDALSKLARGRERTWATSWIVFTDHLEIEEGFGFLQRVKLYQAFLAAQLDTLDGFPHRSIRDLRRRLAQLKGAQEVGRLRANFEAFDLAGKCINNHVLVIHPINDDSYHRATSEAEYHSSHTELAGRESSPDASANVHIYAHLYFRRHAIQPVSTSPSTHTSSSISYIYHNVLPHPVFN